MSQSRITKKKSWEKEEKEAAAVEAAEADRTIVDDTDDLLDEIDGLLEDQVHLTNYRQKGGQ